MLSPVGVSGMSDNDVAVLVRMRMSHFRPKPTEATTV